MYKAIVLLCTIFEPVECQEFYNPQIVNRTEEECIEVSMAFIDSMYRDMPFPISAGYRCEYDAGV